MDMTMANPTGHRSIAGFTLIELMIAVAIVTVGASLAAPEFVRWHSRTQLRQATSEIASQLTMARMAAMNKNRGVDVTIEMASGGVNIWAVANGGSSVIPKTWLASRVTAVTGAPVTISFSSLGVKTSGGTATQTFGVCDVNKQQYSVQIIPAGRVNWSPTATATPCP
jgi:prepilin-type N-terminal cleavage/methylation domain-containing protein